MGNYPNAMKPVHT